ncbi:integral membrane [Moniliophthora roreri MCA 2997]|uniref:Integral membrane n=2 Tax=Moniliophthora roreri TaxID=221103 RepID=V2WT73_MONRO|nr:integral membrane [Moniliophthora roreri MCA 2997]KAI3613156.1 integral membrane [Moniliophthora roreri]
MSQRSASQASSRRRPSRGQSQARNSSASPAPQQQQRPQRPRRGGGGKKMPPVEESSPSSSEKAPLLGGQDPTQALTGGKNPQDALMGVYDEAKMLDNAPELDAIKGQAAEDAIKLRLEVNLDVVVTLRATVHGDLTVSLFGE